MKKALLFFPVLLFVLSGCGVQSSGQGEHTAEQFEEFAETNPYNFVREIKFEQERMEGQDIQELQERLVELGYVSLGAIDGIYGRMTEGAVKELQERMGLTPTGIVDRALWDIVFSGENEESLTGIVTAGEIISDFLDNEYAARKKWLDWEREVVFSGYIDLIEGDRYPSMRITDNVHKTVYIKCNGFDQDDEKLLNAKAGDLIVIRGILTYYDRSFGFLDDYLISAFSCSIGADGVRKKSSSPPQEQVPAVQTPQVPQAPVFPGTHRLTTDAKLYTGQDFNSAPVASLKKGTAVQLKEYGGYTDVDGETAKWAQVSTAEGQTGWVFSGYLGPN